MTRRQIWWGLGLISAGVLMIGLVVASVNQQESADPYGHSHHGQQSARSGHHAEKKDNSLELLRGPLAAVVAFAAVMAAGTVAVRMRSKKR
ncbi:MAG: hypothetical protein HOQ05_09960 [Corynebacteriales bacterium]|nr:hypothetical protein [Mycobacteriales bacterium]